MRIVVKTPAAVAAGVGWMEMGRDGWAGRKIAAGGRRKEGRWEGRKEGCLTVQVEITPPLPKIFFSALPVPPLYLGGYFETYPSGFVASATRTG